MFNKLIILLFSLSLALALSPALTKNYFFVSKDNHLSYELFQTGNGIVAHTLDSISQYLLIDLPSKEAKSILSVTVRACETSLPIFQRLHHHVQSNSLVYFCPKNSSLLLIDQSSYTIKESLLSLDIQCPVTRLSTDGMSVAILCSDTLFTSGPQASSLIKIDMQAKKITTQILFNQNLQDGEAVVAFTAGKKSYAIATNRIQNGNSLITTVYSLVMIRNTYQLTKLSSFSIQFTSSLKFITKLFSLGNFFIVNNGQDIYFINPQGLVVSSTQAKLKVINGVNHPAVTSQDGNPNLFVQTNFGLIVQYFIVADTLQYKQTSDSYSDLQIAYGNATSGDLTFTLDHTKGLFSVSDVQTSKIIYSAISGYADLMLTEKTYAVIQLDYSTSKYQLYVFDLKTDEPLIQVDLGKISNFYYNKDQQIVSYLKTSMSTVCTLSHVDLVAIRSWSTMDFQNSPYPICQSSIASARLTKSGAPEVVIPVKDNYVIVSEKYGQLIFKAPSVDFTSLNLNFDDLSAYYLVSDQAQNQVTASLYAFDAQSKAFQLQKTQLFESVPVNKKGFFTVNSEMSVALSNNTFFVIDKLDSPISYTFQNNFNLATSFQDANKNQYVLVAYYDAETPQGSVPELFATYGDFVSLPGLRLRTVSGRATGAKSFALHDDLYQSIGLVRFYNANVSKGAKRLISN